jgi:hypothetical protein
MLSRSPVFKVALFIVIMLLVISFAFGTPILADGGGGQPFPPDEIPPADGNSNGSSLLVAVLSILQFVL